MGVDVLDAVLELDLEPSVLTGTGETPAVGPDPEQAAVDAEFVAIVLAVADTRRRRRDFSDVPGR